MTVLAFALCGIAIGARATVTALDPVLEAQTIEALLDACAKHHLTDKEICALLRYDQAQWSRIKALKLRAPSLTRLSNLPLPVLHDFIPEYMRILVHYKFSALIESAERKRA